MSAGELTEYTVQIDGVAHTMLLDRADAEKRGLIDAEQEHSAEVQELVAARVAAIEEAHRKVLADYDELVKAHAEEITTLDAAHQQAIEDAVAAATAKAAEKPASDEPAKPAAKTRGSTAK